MASIRKPVKPEVYPGWERDLLPINLNFRIAIWPFQQKPTIFMDNYSIRCQQRLIKLFSLLQLSQAVSAVVVVCRKAYPSSYHPLGHGPAFQSSFLLTKNFY